MKRSLSFALCVLVLAFPMAAAAGFQLAVEHPTVRVKQGVTQLRVTVPPSVSLARGEREALQVLIEGDAIGGQICVSRSSSWKKVDGNSTIQVTLARIGPVTTMEASGIETTPGTYLDVMFPFDETGVFLAIQNDESIVEYSVSKSNRSAFPYFLDPHEMTSLWVEFYAPIGTPVGTYVGSVFVFECGKIETLQSVFVSVNVRDMTIPATSSLENHIGLSIDMLCRAHLRRPCGLTDDLNAVKLNRMYAEFLLEHRLSLRLGVVDTGSKSSVTPSTWRYYSDFMLGRASAVGALPSSVAYPLHWSMPNLPISALHMSRWFKEMSVMGLSDLTFHMIGDEPYKSSLDWAVAGFGARYARSAAPGLSILLTASIYQATSPNWVVGESPYMPDVQENVDILAPLIQHVDDKPNAVPSGNQMSSYVPFLRHQDQTPRNRVWSYSSCFAHSCGPTSNDYFTGWPNLVIDAAGIQARSEPWMSFIYGLSGFLYYEAANWPLNESMTDVEMGKLKSPFDKTDFWSDVIHGNGDGLLVYPGAPRFVGGYHESPLASVRLKLLRDGLEDYEYLLKCSAKCPAEAMRLATQMFAGGQDGGAFSVWNHLSETDAQRADSLAIVREQLSACASINLAAPSRDSEPLSPPIVGGPIYACSRVVVVRGIAPGAIVTVSVNGNPRHEDEFLAHSSSDAAYMTIPFSTGDVVTATQRLDGSTQESGTSNAVAVRSAKDDYPNGFPKLEVHPELLRECSGVVGWRETVPGAVVRMSRSTGLSAPDVYARSELTVSHLRNAASVYEPLELKEEVWAFQEICAGNQDEYVRGAESDRWPVGGSFQPLPPTLVAPYSGSRHVGFSGVENGANVVIESLGRVHEGPELSISRGRSTSWYHNVGETVEARQHYCSDAGSSTFVSVVDCRELPAVKVTPIHSQDTIISIEGAYPGAVVLVRRGSDVIGNAGGREVRLIGEIFAGDHLDVFHYTRACDEAAITSVVVMP